MATKFVSLDRLKTAIEKLKSYVDKAASVYIVNVDFDQDPAMADKTYDEISAAYTAGKDVRLHFIYGLTPIVVPVNMCAFNRIVSSGSMPNGDDVWAFAVIYADGAWSLNVTSMVPETRTINDQALSDSITLTASDVGAATVSSYTFTIGTSWNGSSAPYTQTIAVSGIRSTDDPIVDLIASTTNYEKEIEAYAKVFKITTAAGKLTVFATEKTTTALTCKLKVVR